MEEKYSLTCPDGPAIAPVLWAMFLTTQVMAASWPSATTSGVVRLSTKLGTEKKTKDKLEHFHSFNPNFHSYHSLLQIRIWGCSRHFIGIGIFNSFNHTPQPNRGVVVA